MGSIFSWGISVGDEDPLGEDCKLLSVNCQPWQYQHQAYLARPFELKSMVSSCTSTEQTRLTCISEAKLPSASSSLPSSVTKTPVEHLHSGVTLLITCNSGEGKTILSRRDLCPLVRSRVWYSSSSSLSGHDIFNFYFDQFYSCFTDGYPFIS